MTIPLPWPLSRVVVPNMNTASSSSSSSSATTPTQLKTSPQTPPPMLKRRVSVSSLLRHYEKPGVAPPSSRVDPSVKQQDGLSMTLWSAAKLGVVVAFKATELVADVFTHTMWGPRKKSWGIQMTILSSIMRGAGQHSQLVDIATIRTFISLGNLIPLPPDALVTPLTFRVRKRNLRGILAAYDAQEDGSRELSGEWVVSKKLWQKLQAEWKHGQHNSKGKDEKTDKTEPRKQYEERVILFLHGGAYYLASPATHRGITVPLSKATGCRVFALDYRLAPETRFPGSLHDAATSYLRLVDDLHIPPQNILIAGDSAGGGLSLALLMYLRDNDYPMPGGAILMSPWVDLTLSCDSWDRNAAFDIVPIPAMGDHLDPVACYLGPHMERYLTHPYASPLFGTFQNLPPLLIQSGEAEVLRDEITLLAHKATLAGVEVRHELYEDAVHVFQAFAFLDASKEAFASCREWVRCTLPRIVRERGREGLERLEGEAERGMEVEIDNEKARVVRADGMEKMWEDKEEMAEGSGSGSGSGTEDDGKVEVEGEGEGGDEADVGGMESSAGGDLGLRLVKSHEVLTLSPTSRKPSSASIGKSSGRSYEHLNFFTANRASKQASAPSHTHQVPSSSLTLPHTTRPSFSSRSSYSRTPKISSLKMSSTTADSTHLSAPAPGIRRSSTSHPDISSLVSQWQREGPANVTMTFGPGTSDEREDVSSKATSGLMTFGRRKKACSFSSPRAFAT